MTSRLTNRFKTLIVNSLLILFLGYYGSITLFYHSHVILGDTIVHSHPYRTNSHGIPSHSHSDNAYLTIQFLSVIASSFIISCFAFKTIPPVVYEIAQKVRQGEVIHRFCPRYYLRAPPSKMVQ